MKDQQPAADAGLSLYVANGANSSKTFSNLVPIRLSLKARFFVKLGCPAIPLAPHEGKDVRIGVP